jgi:hypothetical protein
MLFVRSFTAILAVAVIICNLAWWRREGNKHYGETIIPPVMYALLVLIFNAAIQWWDLEINLLNAVSLGIRSVSLTIFIVYAAQRKDHANANGFRNDPADSDCAD